MPVTIPSPQTARNGEVDTRPRFGIGHMAVAAADVSRLATYYERIGFRPVVTMDRFAIVELRGGTHIILRPGVSGQATLDLIVDDIDETRDVFVAVGSEPSAITRGHPHDRFVVADPEGNTLVVNSNHAMGPV